jgi:hypothetical protein
MTVPYERSISTSKKIILHYGRDITRKSKINVYYSINISLTQKIIVLYKINIYATEGIFLHCRKPVLTIDGRVLQHTVTAWAEYLHTTERVADILT